MKILDLNLHALQYFIDSIAMNSLTLAARKNHVSRPAVSQAIKRIEEVVGFELIEHTKNRLKLTRDGQAFYQKAKEGLQTLKATLHGEPAQELLTIACSASLAEHLLLPALKRLDIKELRLRIGTSARVRQLVSDQEAQIGIFIDDEKGFGLRSTILQKGHFRLYSTSGRFEGPLITTEARPEVVHFHKCLASSRRKVTQHFEVESWSLCKKAAETFSGTCVLPDFMADSKLKRVRSFEYQYLFKILAVSGSGQPSHLESALIQALQNE